jgi:hypothetical protein
MGSRFARHQRLTRLRTPKFLLFLRGPDFLEQLAVERPMALGKMFVDDLGSAWMVVSHRTSPSISADLSRHPAASSLSC